MQLSDVDNANNLVALFFARVADRPDAPFLGAKHDGEWKTQSWNEVAAQVCLLAQALRDMGLERGDRVMLVSENRPEWCIADLAIMAAGCVTVPTYITNTERDHAHILDNSGAKAVIVSNAKLAKPLLPAIMRTGTAEYLIAIDTLPEFQSGDLTLRDWKSMLAGDPAAARRAVDARLADIKRGDLACIIYTSGTGGAPRGVMQHHGAILCNAAGAAEILATDFGLSEDERFLSFLPLSHAYEHSGGQYLPIAVGAQIFYAEGLDKLASNIEEVRPTIMVVVPRLFEVLRTRILKQIEKQGKPAQYMMDRAIAIGTHKADGGASGDTSGRLRLRDRPMDLVLEKLFRPKIRAKFGGRIKAMVSGGAPLNPDVGIFFDSVGLTMLQGYGQTEAGPVISCNRPAAGIAMDTVGPPMRGVDIAFADDGEILVRGELVMLGYWQNDQETARTIRDGWLHTGDIGHLDGSGRIKITDRKKDMIVNDKGDNVAPQKVEGMLTLQPEIAQAMVTGDQRPYVVGLIVPDAEWAVEWCHRHGKTFDMAQLQTLPEFRTAIGNAVARVNAELSIVEKVRQFAFADEGFTIENEEMTPSMKIRRHKIRERYQPRLDTLYKK